MKIYLAVFFLLTPTHEWVSGDTLDGWAKREQPSMEVCLKRRDIATRQPLPHFAKEQRWACMVS